MGVQSCYRVFADGDENPITPKPQESGFGAFWRRLFSEPTPNTDLNPFAVPGLTKSQHEAIRITIRANDILEASLKRVCQLPVLFDQSRRDVEQARKEMEEEAFGPFWDAIEGAAYKLAEFDEIVKMLTKNGAMYHADLDSVRHNFPPFPTDVLPVPNPKQVLDEFHMLVRKAQRDFRFASIWEQRKTRAVLIDGLHSIGDAVDNLGSRIVDSISKMERSLSSRIASMENSLSSRLGELTDLQERAMDDAQAYRQNISSMLDNIQRGRKPLI